MIVWWTVKIWRSVNLWVFNIMTSCFGLLFWISVAKHNISNSYVCVCVSLSLSPAGRASHIPMPVNNNAVVLSVLAMFLPLPHGFVLGMCEAERKEYETWVFEWVYVYVCVCVCVCQAYYILVFSTKLCFSTFFFYVYSLLTHIPLH